MFTDEASKKLGAQGVVYSEGVVPPMGQTVFRMDKIFDRRLNLPRSSDIEPGKMTRMGHSGQEEEEENEEEMYEEEEEEPQLSTWGAIILLAGTTVLTGATAEFLVSFSRFGLRV